MKKSLLLLLSLTALAGCSSGEADENDASQAESSNETTENVDTSSEGEASSENSSEETSGESELPDEPVAYEYEINPGIFTVEPINEASPEVALLTFDDAPQPPDSHAIEIANTVKDKGANAIFFLIGQFLEDEEAKQIVKEIYDMGFEIGNHSYSHPDFYTLTYEEQQEEITKTNQLIEDITGEKPRFLRLPYGQFDENTLAIIEEEGMTMMNWTYGYDWEEAYMNGPALADIMVNTEFLGSGANLLMHDRPWTSEAIGDIIDGLREKGYEMVDPKLIASPEREEE
ncbi:polysaccharide deacetylase family protein [Jeotgalibaca ciconiae]|uniref:Polysaccharide deacetylase family protein n=1 Tax=Jeotgalibaca ciconiae TaxID=2496265 RepID=A0A3S9HDK1_9LACT|nr:polysaccharide deacetylase family protein [Jeotgalibaca ciconiae]AZP05424.1 polysaccharide deacetylase family protein [Jeotgalibaca ciconiae]HJB24075.1 polysaccharide deacetylase family protein [Candidatus Jeotgalibaca pullicola]